MGSQHPSHWFVTLRTAKGGPYNRYLRNSGAMWASPPTNTSPYCHRQGRRPVAVPTRPAGYIRIVGAAFGSPHPSHWSVTLRTAKGGPYNRYLRNSGAMWASPPTNNHRRRRYHFYSLFFLLYSLLFQPVPPASLNQKAQKRSPDEERFCVYQRGIIVLREMIIF